MIILFTPGLGLTVDPVVILDYTRSDDQYSPAQIAGYIAKLGVFAAKGKTVNPDYTLFSLDYSMSYTHSGTTYGNSLKTKFTATISNAPLELVTLLNIKQYVSKVNVEALTGAVTSVIDPQVFFPTGGFVIKPNSNSLTTITRTFMLYDTPFNFDARRINSTLILHGSDMDSMVIKLLFNANISKTKGPLSIQLNEILAGQGYGLNPDEEASTMLPKVDRYYPPAPMNTILNQICRDNGLFHDVDPDLQLVTLKSTALPPVPTTPPPICSFNNYIPGSNLIGPFSLQNYATCIFEAEAFDISLFDTVVVYDDSLTEGQFSNLSFFEAVPVGTALILGYQFYVLEYTYTDSRMRTSITVKGTNNWLISNFKLDALLEAKVYGNLG